MEELLFAFLASRPEFRRAKRCRKKLVGPMRQYLITHGGVEALAEFAHLPDKANRLIRQRWQAQEAIVEFCTRCGRCDWGQLMASPARDKDRAADRDR